ncbi:MAG: hypothetical protein M3Q27_14235 [Actinomycetota bacterium]|nr:hypothetical protein [Actinomycetota bacterium]
MDLHEGSQPVDPAREATVEPLGIDVAGEAPEADAAEQHTPVVEHQREEPVTSLPDADPADVADQHRVVELDEDDYR